MCFLLSHRAWLAVKLWQALRLIGLLRCELLICRSSLFPFSEYFCIFLVAFLFREWPHRGLFPCFPQSLSFFRRYSGSFCPNIILRKCCGLWGTFSPSCQGLKKFRLWFNCICFPFFYRGKTSPGQTQSLTGAAAAEETLFQPLVHRESDGCIPWRGLPCISNETISVMGI